MSRANNTRVLRPRAESPAPFFNLFSKGVWPNSLWLRPDDFKVIAVCRALEKQITELYEKLGELDLDSMPKFAPALALQLCLGHCRVSVALAPRIWVGRFLPWRFTPYFFFAKPYSSELFEEARPLLSPEMLAMIDSFVKADAKAWELVQTLPLECLPDYNRADKLLADFRRRHPKSVTR